MKLVVLLSVATLVACDHSASRPERPTEAYAKPDKIEPIGETSAPIEPGKPFFGFDTYKGTFPPSRFYSSAIFPSPSFYPFTYPFKAVNFANPPQGIIPPQFSQIIPPIFGNNKPVFPSPSPAFPAPSPVFPAPSPAFPAPSPAFPAPSPSLPTQVFPPLPQPITAPLFGKLTFPYFPLATPYLYPYAFHYPLPSSFALPPSPSFAPQKQPAKSQSESLSSSYGPPETPAAEPEPAGTIETSAPFEQTPVSYPYEAAAPEEHETSLPHTPAQEYGPPSGK